MPVPTLAPVLVRPPGPRPRVLPAPSRRVAEGAALLLADHALAPLPSGRAWQVVSEDGSRLYLASPKGCTCAAGLHGYRCKHSVAAEIATAATSSRPSRRCAAQAARYWRAARRAESTGRPSLAAPLRELARASALLAREAARAGR